jgi:serine/threonine protein kinase
MRELLLENCRIERRYDIVRRLGIGSYSEIFLATDNFAASGSPNRNVVIKALNVSLQDDVDADLERTLLDNFQNEALSLDKVRHPNIVNRLGHGTARDLDGKVFHYLVLEYLAGGDLQSEVRNGPIPIETALSYLEQICAGLKFAHEQGVIHRDVKPHNILLSVDRKTVKVTDFGVARGLLADGPITRVGSNVYAPPEHSPFVSAAVGTVVKLGPSSDIYSLAKTAYAMLTGEIPRKFTGSPISSLPDIGMSDAAASQVLAVLKRATQDDPQDRYLTISAFWGDISTAFLSEVDDEVDTVVSKRYVPPQPYVSRGYNPIPPQGPSFREPLIADRPRGAVLPNAVAAPVGGEVGRKIDLQPPNGCGCHLTGNDRRWNLRHSKLVERYKIYSGFSTSVYYEVCCCIVGCLFAKYAKYRQPAYWDRYKKVSS